LVVPGFIVDVVVVVDSILDLFEDSLLDLFLFKDAKIRFESQYSLLWMHLCISAFKSKSTAEARLVVVLGVVDVVVDVVVVVVGNLKSLPLVLLTESVESPKDLPFNFNVGSSNIELVLQYFGS